MRQKLFNEYFVVSENSNKELKSTTLNCITAAKIISEEIHVVVIGRSM